MQKSVFSPAVLMKAVFLIMVFITTAHAEPLPAAKTDKLAVLTFDIKADEEIDAEILTETFQTELMNQPKRKFSIVERSQLNKIFQEQKLQLAGLTEEQALKIGNLAGANLILIANISRWEEKFIINVKAIDTTSAEIRFADKLETYDKQGLMDLLPSMAERTVRKFLGENVTAYVADPKSLQRSKDKEKQRKDGDDRRKTAIQRGESENIRRQPEPKPAVPKPAYRQTETSEMAFEIGFIAATPSFTPALFSSPLLWDFRFNFRIPGNGIFQIILGFDYMFGDLNSANSLSYFYLYPGMQLNLIDNRFLVLGLGMNINWGPGTATYTSAAGKYEYPFYHTAMQFYAELGFYVDKDVIIKAEVGYNLPIGLEYDTPTKTYSLSNPYPVETTDGRTIYVPQSIYVLKDGLQYLYYGIKMDILF